MEGERYQAPSDADEPLEQGVAAVAGTEEDDEGTGVLCVLEVHNSGSDTLDSLVISSYRVNLKEPQQRYAKAKGCYRRLGTLDESSRMVHLIYLNSDNGIEHQ